MRIFQKLGLSFYESKSLDILLKEQLTPKDLARKAGIPLGKVYSVVKELKHQNLISETASRPKLLYIPDPSAAIKILIDQKQHSDETLFAELRSIASDVGRLRSTKQRFFQFGTTQEENKEIQLRTFLEAQEEVCQIINIHHKPKTNRSSKTIWENEIARSIKRGVIFKSIYPENTALPEILQNLPKEKFVVRRLNTDFTRCDIIDRRKVLIKLVHEDALSFGGVIFIEDEKFARNLHNVFEKFWNEAKNKG